MNLHCIERGQGRPLVLLHGIGMSSAAWAPVLDLLAAQRRVLAFDLPGFGRSAPLPAGTSPTPRALAQAVVDALAAKGIEEPVDVAGNSLGGGIALEMAVMQRCRSVVGISPSRLWKKRAPLHIGPLFWGMRQAVNRLPGLTERILGFAPSRTLMLAASYARGWQVPAEEAIAAAHSFAASEVFDATFDACQLPLGEGKKISCPCSVAFGTFDFVLTASAQRRELLPAQALWLRPKGWGHVPMWDDPPAVAAFILAGTK